MYLGSNIVGIDKKPVAVFVFDDALILLRPLHGEAPTFKDGQSQYNDIDETRQLFVPVAERGEGAAKFAESAAALVNYEIRLILMSAITSARFYKIGGLLTGEKALDVALGAGDGIVFTNFRSNSLELQEFTRLITKPLGSRFVKGH